MANVFISHRGSDINAAEKLAQDLRQDGHHVWIDVWNIHLGDSVIQKINEGLQSATYVVVCYSAYGIESPWMSREWMATLARQLEGHHVRILPVFLSGGDIPAILSDIRYADLTKNWQKGLDELLGVLR
jgi:TIR domain.